MKIVMILIFGAIMLGICYGMFELMSWIVMLIYNGIAGYFGTKLITWPVAQMVYGALCVLGWVLGSGSKSSSKS